MHAYREMLPIWALDLETFLGQPRHNLILSLYFTQDTHMLCLCFHVAEKAHGQHGHLSHD
jgi:hypothetical protein